MKLLIKNATVIDGSGRSGYQASVWTEDAKISRIITKEELTGALHSNVVAEGAFIESEADLIIDAEGMICAPGFIDTHSHSDLKVLSNPQLQPKLMQGITTEILGQDGISMAPLPTSLIEPWKKNLAGLDGEDNSIDWTFGDTSHYLAMIAQAKPALNEGYLLPHGNVRMEAMGLDDRPANKAEIDKMCEITRREMEAGCMGLSSGLIYMPCAYSQTEELIEMCKVVKEYDGLFVVHQRSEADDILTSMDEVIRIGKESGVDIHFSHFKVCGKPNWDKLPQMLSKLDEANAMGMKVSLDQYPYIAGSTMLGVILPPWVHDGGTDMLVERLKDEQLRKKMKEDIATGIDGWDNFVNFAGLEGIFITSVVTAKNQDVIGLSLEQLGEKREKDPLDATFDLLMEEKNAVGMVDFYGTEEHVKAIMKRPEMNLCTDGLLSGKPHPRVYGAFPRLLGKYVREEKVLTLEEAVRKMTGKPANTFRLKNKGLIKEGFDADITVFNADTVKDCGTFTEPEQYPQGIEYVLVNGGIAVDKGKVTGKRCGKVILNKK